MYIHIITRLLLLLLLNKLNVRNATNRRVCIYAIRSYGSHEWWRTITEALASCYFVTVVSFFSHACRLSRSIWS